MSDAKFAVKIICMALLTLFALVPAILLWCRWIAWCLRHILG